MVSRPPLDDPSEKTDWNCSDFIEHDRTRVLLLQDLFSDAAKPDGSGQAKGCSKQVEQESTAAEEQRAPKQSQNRSKGARSKGNPPDPKTFRDPKSELLHRKGLHVLKVKVAIFPQIQRAGSKRQDHGDPNGDRSEPGHPWLAENGKSENNFPNGSPFLIAHEHQDGQNRGDLRNCLVLAVALRCQDHVSRG